MRRIPSNLSRSLALPVFAFAAAACGGACGGADSSNLFGADHDASVPTSGDDDGNNPPGKDAGGNDASHPTGDDGGNATDGTVLTDSGPSDRRQIPPAVLARKAMVYSGYRTGQSPETSTYPSDDQIDADLQILTQGGWTFLRLYDCSPFAASVMRIIQAKGYDFKLMAGVWLSGAKASFDAQNQAQITQCLALFAQHTDLIAAISVGNETLDDWSNVRIPSAELAAYITQVRSQVTQPVTTDDSYLPFTLGTDGSTSYADVVQVAQVVDFLSLHVYAFSDAPYDSWDWEQLGNPPGPLRAQAMMQAAMGYTKASLDGVRAALKPHGLDTLPIVIGEAGWKTSATDTQDDPTEPYRAHQVNQAMFYTPFYDWVYGASKDASSPVAAFWFEAFDEPWKQEDDGWGLFDVNRKARYAMWPQFPQLKPANAPAYSSADAVYYVSNDGGANAKKKH
jgi:exo-beta-1,3-glucanase (GH17 family)